jgi:Mg2+-importing ATPase
MTASERNLNNRENLRHLLLTFSDLDVNRLLEELNTSRQGLSKSTVATKQLLHGPNEIPAEKKESVWRRLFDAFATPFNAVLAILAVISLFTDILLVPPAEKDPSGVIIISIMILVSGAIRFTQEQRADEAARRLKAMVKLTTLVEREAEGKKEIPTEELVPGDIVHLAAGDIIPADVRVIQTRDFFVDQAVLTGESEPVEKVADGPPGNGTPTRNPLERRNLAFMGTNVVSGSAVAVVLATGVNTYFGSLARAVAQKKAVTAFEKGVASVSWLLIRFMASMVPVVFFLNGLTKGNWLDALLFSLSVAVGLTPEMLPMIVTANLGKGAVAMSRKKVIVKRLASIQNFGSMDVLCTDKTGTITENRIVLEMYLDIHGNEDLRVLRHAYMNSYFQTGLKNVVDRAILARAGEEFSWIQENYVKVDEIPFDFSRRRMSVVVKDKTGKTQLITKGAVEEMLSCCSHIEYHGEALPLTPELKKEALDMSCRLSSKGLRVIAVAQKTNPPVEGLFSVKDECDMVLIGFLAFLDPPKEDARETLAALKELGITPKILTGDNEIVTRAIVAQVGLPAEGILLGTDVEAMGEETLKKAAEKTTVFARLTPEQKARVVSALRANGHIVGFLGDGINDAPAMHAADVAISVDNAVDIARETADLILLEKDLKVLENGVLEGRQTYGNIIKYIKITASSNFGNVLSVLAASSFLPFLPMLPLQLLFLNLTYDLCMTTMPWDRTDREFLRRPRRWEASGIGKFMLWLGPISSIFDITTYVAMFMFICPAFFGGPYFKLPEELRAGFATLFQSGWFVESLWTQTLVVHALRSEKIPFLQSRPAPPLLLATTLAVAFGTAVPYLPFRESLLMMPLPAYFYPLLVFTTTAYILLAQYVKILYVKKFGNLL